MTVVALGKAWEVYLGYKYGVRSWKTPDHLNRYLFYHIIGTNKSIINRASLDLLVSIVGLDKNA